MIAVILYILLANSYLTISSPYNVHQLVKRQGKFCGPELTKVLKVVCKGIYYVRNEKKSRKYTFLFVYV